MKAFKISLISICIFLLTFFLSLYFFINFQNTGTKFTKANLIFNTIENKYVEKINKNNINKDINKVLDKANEK